MGDIVTKDSPIAEAQTAIEDDLEQAATSLEEIKIEMGSGSIKKDDWMDIPTESQSHLISILSTVEPEATPTPVTNEEPTEEENKFETAEKDFIDNVLATQATKEKDEPTEEESNLEKDDKNFIDKISVSNGKKHPAKDDAYKTPVTTKDEDKKGISKESKDIVEEQEPVAENDDEIHSTSHTIESKEKELRLMAINNARTGNLKGIDKINYQCQSEAFEAGLDGLFRAFLSSKELHLHNILSPADSVERTIVNSEGDILFKSYQHLIATKGKLNITNIIAPINSFNKKNIIFDEHWPFNLVWTGHDDDESYNGDTKRCNEWTSDDPTLKGVTSDYLFKGLLYTREEPCDDTFIVLCLELGSESYIRTFLNDEEYKRELEAYYDTFRTINKDQIY